MIRLVLLLLLFAGQAAFAAPVDTFEFKSEQQETIFHRLSNELRCLVCQNQSIGDSNADLAKDLRNEIYKMLQQGKSEDEIIDFMVQRYGDFVLYNAYDTGNVPLANAKGKSGKFSFSLRT